MPSTVLPGAPFSVLALAQHLAFLFGGLSASMLVAVIVLRFRLQQREAHNRAFIKRWRVIIMEYIFEEGRRVPPVDAGDYAVLFSLWNHVHETVRGEATERLNALGRETGLAAKAREYAASPFLRRRILGVLALGNLRDGSCWQLLKTYAQDPNTALSLVAARALLFISPAQALPIVTPLLATRSDWSPVRMGGYLAELGPGVIARPLALAAQEAEPREASRLLRYLSATNSAEARPIIRSIAAATQDAGVLAACLPMLREPQDLELVRACAQHAVWFVRVQAVLGLKELATEADTRILLGLLGDPEWWVRYRAAQALTQLPFVDQDELLQICQSLDDKYARDILTQVLAQPEHAA